jgi:hypothetical protein
VKLTALFVSATSVNVERVFSKGWILLSHLCSWLSIQSMRALMCLGEWSRMGFVKLNDIKAVTVLSKGRIDDDEHLADDWDSISFV